MLILMLVFAAGCAKKEEAAVQESAVEAEVQEASTEAEEAAGEGQKEMEAVSEEEQTEGVVISEEKQAENGAEEQTAAEETSEKEVTVLGEGKHRFFFTVTDKEGQEAYFEIHTDKEMVGEALLDLGLIAGEEGEFGLYVKEVNGITADYDADQTYWAFYVNGEYAMTGVDATAIEEGTEYSMKVEK